MRLDPARVCAFNRNADGETVHFRGQLYLAGKAAGPAHAGGKVEHVFFFFRGTRQRVEPLGGDDNMAGGARHLPLTSPFQREPCGLADTQKAVTRFAGGLNRLAAWIDKGDAYARHKWP